MTALTAAAACTMQTDTPAPPSQRPATEKPLAQLTAPAPTGGSAYYKNYYAKIQHSLLVHDQLRRDGGGPDTPYTAEMLARNFERIAFNSEYSTIGNRRVSEERAVKLTRWTKPVRYALNFGEAVPEEDRAKDQQTFSKYVSRLARHTRHPISASQSGANFNVFILTEDERRNFGAQLQSFVPGISLSDQREITGLRRDTQCVVLAVDRDDDNRIERAIAVIRAELPDRMRTACLHEEMAQGLGLPNDSPVARPSIFNDSDEFGLLTSHDELLLQMLYDRRLRPGMSADEARLTINKIAAELVDGTV
nr:DUF2927 domain-containing protein [Aliiroseovarius sp. F20344]